MKKKKPRCSLLLRLLDCSSICGSRLLDNMWQAAREYMYVFAYSCIIPLIEEVRISFIRMYSAASPNQVIKINA